MIESLVSGKLVCVALNDRQHLINMHESFHSSPHKAPPTQPVLYFKPRNTWNVDGAKIEWPDNAEDMVVGASLGIVIGREVCRISPEQSLSYLSGYTVVHDFSLPEASYYRPDIKGKCLDGTAPVGPASINTDLVPDLNNLAVVTCVDGEVKSTLSLANHVRDVAELLSTISYIMTLQVGDVIAVGFPCERVALHKGAVVSSTIEGVGTLTNTVGGA